MSDEGSLDHHQPLRTGYLCDYSFEIAVTRVLAVTTFYPNSANPQRTVFVANLVHAMRQSCVVHVVSPVPYVPPFAMKQAWRNQRAIPPVEKIDGMDVEHPRYVVLPKFGWFSGFGYFLGVWNTLRRWQRLASAGGDKIIVHVHCAYPDAVGVALASKILRLPYVVTAHGSDINVYAQRVLTRFQIRWALRQAAGVIAVSRDLEDKIRTLANIDPMRLRTIPCAGFSPQVFVHRPREQALRGLNLDPQTSVVVFVGLLVPIKGIEFLIEAWSLLVQRGRLHKGDSLILLGEGPLRGELERQARDAGVAEGIRFVGMVPQADVARWLSIASLLCLPSRSEGTPNVVVEALASGIPVVATSVGGIPELIHDGENGMLIPPGDVVALASALERTLSRTWDSTKIANSVAHLTWRNIAENNCEFLESLSHEF